MAFQRRKPAPIGVKAPYRLRRAGAGDVDQQQQRETLPITGFALKANKFDGIYLGRRKGKNLVYAGKVDHGFEPSSTAELQKRLQP